MQLGRLHMRPSRTRVGYSFFCIEQLSVEIVEHFFFLSWIRKQGKPRAIASQGLWNGGQNDVQCWAQTGKICSL